MGNKGKLKSTVKRMNPFKSQKGKDFLKRVDNKRVSNVKEYTILILIYIMIKLMIQFINSVW